MNILIAPDSFKESLSAIEVCKAIRKGIFSAIPEANISAILMADGGEGTIESVLNSQEGELVNTTVHDPLMRPVKANYAIMGNTAIIEIAQASGLELLKIQERNPLITSTYGTGELIRDALNKGCTKFIIGIGGSATNDGGVGMLEALGAKFLDNNGEAIPKGGGSLDQIIETDLSNLDNRIAKSQIQVACDVTNPLLGKNGCAHVYARQKGADESMIKILENGMSHFSQLVTKKLGKDWSNESGAGAAGGLGFGLISILDAELQSGFKLISELVGLEKHIQHADLIFTGEGKIDAQTNNGKVPFGIAQLAKKYKTPVICLVGTKGNIESIQNSFNSIHALTDENVSSEYAMKNAFVLLEEMSIRAIRDYKNW